MTKTAGFGRRQRLRTRKEFGKLFDSAKRIFSDNLLVLWKKSDKNPVKTRIGIITGKKVAKSAVARNRIRRVIRESFRLAKDMLPMVDMIVIARGQCGNMEKTAISQETGYLWKKLQLHYQRSQSSS